MAFENVKLPDTLKPYYSQQRVDEILEESSYKTPWYGVAARTVGRVPFRFVDDVVNTASDLSGGFVPRIDSEGSVLGNQQGATENIMAELGSLAFGVGATGKVLKGAGQLAQRSKKIERINKTFQTQLKALEGTRRGRAINISRILADGALKGGIADFMAADVDAEGEIMDRIEKRIEDVWIGMAIGGGLNLGINKIANRKTKKVITGLVKEAKEGQKEALKGLAKGLNDEALDETAKDTALKMVAALDEAEGDIARQTQNYFDGSDDYVNRATSYVKKEKVEEFENILKKENPEDIKEDIIKKFVGMKSLPELAKDFNIFIELTHQNFLPKVNDLYRRARFIVNKRSPINARQSKDFLKLQEEVNTFEKALVAYREAIVLRSKLGTLAGKLLQSLRKTGRAYARKSEDIELGNDSILFDINRGDFNKTVEFSGEVQDKLYRIDTLLNTIKKSRQVDPEDLKSFIIDLDPDKKGIFEAIGQTGKAESSVIKDVVMSIGKANKNAVWNNYKEGIIDALKKKKDDVLKNLSGKEKKKAKPLLEYLSNNIQKRIARALNDLKDPTKVDKLKALSKRIQETQDFKNNAEDITKELKALDIVDIDASVLVKQDIEAIADELVKIGDIAFLDDLGLDEDFVGALRKQLDVTIENNRIRLLDEQLIKDLELEDQIDFISDLIKSGDENKIVEFFENHLKNTGKGKSELQKLLAKRKAELTAEYNKIKGPQEFAKKIVEDVDNLSKRTDIGMPSRTEKWAMGWDRMRMNNMMLHPNTWLVGILSGMFHLIEQPVKLAVKSFSLIKKLKKIDDKDKNLQNTEDYQYAWSQISTLLDVHTLKQAMANGLSSFRKGQSAFNTRLRSRFHTEFMNISGIDFDPAKLAKLDKEKAEELEQMLRLYGTDNKLLKAKTEEFFQSLDAEKGTLSKIFDVYNSISFRAMGAIDDVFRTYGTMRALRAEAMQKALVAGKTSKEEINTFMEEYMKKGYSEVQTTAKEAYGVGGDRKVNLLKWNNLDEFNTIEQQGLAITYQADFSDRVFSRMIEAATRWSRNYKEDNPARFFVRNVILPFAKTPAAISQWMLDNSIVTGIYRRLTATKQLQPTLRKIDDELATARKKALQDPDDLNVQDRIKELEQQHKNIYVQAAHMEAEANADIVMGTFWTSTFTMLGSMGSFTGSGAHMTEDERRMAEAAGWKPFSLKVGDKYISYEKFEPVATFIAIAADLGASQRRKQEFGKAGDYASEDEKGLFNTAVTAFSEILQTKFFVGGIGDLFSIIDSKDPFGAAQQFSNNYIASITPASRIIREVNELAEPYQKRATDYQDKLAQRIYGGSRAGYYRNIFGEKMLQRRKGSGFIERASNSINPYFISQRESDPVIEQLASMQFNWGQTARFRRSIQGQFVDTREYKDKKGRDLYDAWLEHYQTYKISNKTVRKKVTEDLKKLLKKRIPITGTSDSVTTRLNAIINRYEKDSFEDFIKLKGNNFINPEGVSIQKLKPKTPLQTLIKTF